MKLKGSYAPGIKIDKAGKIVKAQSRRTSVSQKIAQQKSKRVRVARRTA